MPAYYTAAAGFEVTIEENPAIGALQRHKWIWRRMSDLPRISQYRKTDPPAGVP